MSEILEEHDMMPLKPCPRCADEGVEPPLSRHQQPSGAWSVYCTPHTRAYQKERRDAKKVLLSPDAHEADLLAAAKALVPKPRGRRPGDNMCPECSVSPRANGSSYCADCTKAYRKAKDERAYARQLEVLAVEATANREFKAIVTPRYREGDPALIPPKDMMSPEELLQPPPGEPLYQTQEWKKDEAVPQLGPPPTTPGVVGWEGADEAEKRRIADQAFFDAFGVWPTVEAKEPI